MFPKQKIALGLSGGVDSAVAAALLKKSGYELTGIFMINWQDNNDSSLCKWRQEYADAQTVAQKLDLKIFTWNFCEEYQSRVFEYLIKTYQAGLTPNPDIFCNQYIKFGVFLDQALQLNFDKIATGHYAQIKNREGQFELWTGRDLSKDQSYFLYRLNQHQLAHSLFPLGKLRKKKIRRLAQKFKLPVWNKKDSYGICHVGEKNMPQFLSRFIKFKPGNIINTKGKILGTHSGLYAFTYGQRTGIGIGGTGPYYVLAKNLQTNELIITNDKNDPALFKSQITLDQMHWISDQQPKIPFNCQARYRHLGPLVPVTVSQNKNKLQIKFSKPQPAVAPGQSLVLYKKPLLCFNKEYQILGGGIIQ